MKKIICLLLLIVYSFTIAFSQTENKKEQTENWTTLKGDNYAIQHPSNWDVDKSGQMNTSFFLFSPIENEIDDFRENINLIIQDLTGYDLTLEQFTELTESQVKTLITNANMISSETVERDNRTYQKMIYTGSQGVYNLQFEQFFWVIDNKAIILTLTCKEDAFNSYRKLGEKIMHSFKYKVN